MTRRLLLPLCAVLTAALVFSPAALGARKGKSPVVTSVTPKSVKVGDKLTLRGKNFLPGKGRTRVFFVRVRGKGVATAKAESATRSRVVVIVPTPLNDALAGKSARFRLRVLASRFGPWTKGKNAPVVASTAATDGGGSGSNAPEADCDQDGQANRVDGDDDNDLLPDTQESQLGTDPCNGDTDRDTAQDGYEYQSALDLNRTVLFGSAPPIPYPGKRPFPNALFPDAGLDYDGDGLSDGEEHALWLRYGNHVFPLNYSAGIAMSVPTPAPDPAVFPHLEQLDMSAYRGRMFDGRLDDGERDADGDGLSNFDETHGRMWPEWWPKTFDGKRFPKETTYPVSYPGTDHTDPDSDGDGVLDGGDDQDHDGLTNQYEVARPYNWSATYVSVGPGLLGHSGMPTPNPWARVDPFNPCKPVYSSTCHSHPPFGHYGEDEDWEGMSPDDASSTYGAPGVTAGPLHP